MADRQLSQIISQLKSCSPKDAPPLLSRAKLLLLPHSALTPTPQTPATYLPLARTIFELGALHSIGARDAPSFTRYVSQLRPFYDLPTSQLKPDLQAQNKVIGLSLLLLLTQGRYGEFHSELEGLGSVDVEEDKYLGYPVRLERWLMEGSYDRVWRAMRESEVPCEEYSVFSDILKNQIRNEIASSSERAYPSLPISSTKSLLFLDSEGDVVSFAKHRGWLVKDGRIFFPDPSDEDEDDDEDDEDDDDDDEEEEYGASGKTGAKRGRKEMSQMVIENALGYARELETIV